MSANNWQSYLTNQTLLATFAGLGAIYALKQLSSIASFAYTHFLRPSSLARYNSASDGKSASWALVTGASDGIGKGFAEELCHRGFNVILHGRNEKKLNAVRQEMLKHWPKREIKLLIFDAGSETSNTAKLEAAVNEVKSLDLRVLVNNVGGGSGVRPAYLAFHETKADRTNLLVDLNLRFPTEITRVILPQLIQHAPALILNIGSIASDVQSPYVSVYSGAKGFNKSWSNSLSLELQSEGYDVEVKLIQTGMVSSGSEPRDVGVMIPSSRGFAKTSLDKVGNANRLVYGFWAHELQHKFVDLLPTKLSDRILGKLMLQMREEERKNLKEQ